jgi:ribose 5-phosphate isomerase B
MRFYVGSDHGGVTLRKLLTADLRELGHEVVAEHGPASVEEKADYPDVAHAVAHAVVGDPGSFGLLVCGTGQGVCMAANTVPGVRAGVVLDPFSARMLRAHNDANVLCLGERVVGTELARVLLREFLGTEFEGGRHARRVGKIEAGEH